jgi:hypothetical protein
MCGVLPRLETVSPDRSSTVVRNNPPGSRVLCLQEGREILRSRLRAGLAEVVGICSRPRPGPRNYSRVVV